MNFMTLQSSLKVIDNLRLDYTSLFLLQVHKEDVVGFGISSNGKFMMSCSNDSQMIIWDLKGQQLERLDTYLMSTYTAKISPCGRFVVATGFAPDVKVMEVCFTKTGEYKQVSKAYELTGHTSGVYDVAFAVDTSHIATISKDGTWKLYHTRSKCILLLSSPLTLTK